MNNDIIWLYECLEMSEIWFDLDLKYLNNTYKTRSADNKADNYNIIGNNTDDKKKPNYR